MKGITVSTFLPDSPQAYTQVSFSLPYRDWCQLEKTVEWKNFQEKLLELQSKDSQKFHLMQEEK